MKRTHTHTHTHECMKWKRLSEKKKVPTTRFTRCVSIQRKVNLKSQTSLFFFIIQSGKHRTRFSVFCIKILEREFRRHSLRFHGLQWASQGLEKTLYNVTKKVRFARSCEPWAMQSSAFSRSRTVSLHRIFFLSLHLIESVLNILKAMHECEEKNAFTHVRQTKRSKRTLMLKERQSEKKLNILKAPRKGAKKEM